MDNLTIVIPYWNELESLRRTLKSIPDDVPIIVVDDHSDVPLNKEEIGKRCEIIRPEKKGYFTGAVNAGLEQCSTDVLVLNQDVELQGKNWLDLLFEKRADYAIVGENITGLHPAWPKGYAHGTFWFLRRDMIEQVGMLNQIDYPLWGSTCEYQLRACRKGYKALPTAIPGLIHHRERGYGKSILETLRREPQNKSKLIRTPPEISVIVPCYNYGRFLPDLVNSLIGGDTSLGHMPGQTFQSFEIVIVDDASTDEESVEMTQSLADDWKGVHVVKHSDNRGTAAALNTAVKHSYGWAIAAMDSDDMMETGRLEKLYRVLQENSHSMVYDDMTVFGDGKRGKKYPIRSEYDFDLLLSKNHVPAGIVFTRKAWKNVGGWPEEFGNGRQDWAMAVRLGAFGYCGIRVKGADYLYRREGHNRTLTNTNPRARQKFLAKMMRAFPDLYAGKRPPGCCGNGAGKAEVGNEDVFLRYVGGNWGTQTYTGVKQRYVFGKSRPLSAVDHADASRLLAIRENGKPIFVIEGA